MRSVVPLMALLALAFAGCSGLAPGDPPPPSGFEANPFRAPGPIVVQVDHVPGRAPAPLALDALATVMDEVGTPAEIRVSGHLQTTDGNYTAHDVAGVHRATYGGDLRTWRDSQGTPVLHVLLLEGAPWDPDEANTTIGWSLKLLPVVALFPDLMHVQLIPGGAVPLSTIPPDQVLRSALIHEYGHQLGLVGCDLPQIEAHGKGCHSTRESSVMWPTMHTSDYAQWILDDDLQPIWRFDDADWADIRAFQASLPVEPRAGSASTRAGPRGVDFKSQTTK